jgi:hypothetical protein
VAAVAVDGRRDAPADNPSSPDTAPLEAAVAHLGSIVLMGKRDGEQLLL